MIRFVNNFLSTEYPYMETPGDPISYKYNSNGHRSKDIKNLDTENYILFAGCSNTEGYGLEVEEVYTHIVAKKLDMDYYNMGVSGSGCDVMFYNIMTWLHKYEHKPKMIVLQWPFTLRFARVFDNGGDKDEVQTEGSWSTDLCATFSIMGERIGYFPLRTKMYYNITRHVNIPIVDVSFLDYNNKILESYIEFTEYDKARDNSHPGPKSHQNLAEKIVDHVKNNNLLV